MRVGFSQCAAPFLTPQQAPAIRSSCTFQQSDEAVIMRIVPPLVAGLVALCCLAGRLLSAQKVALELRTVPQEIVAQRMQRLRSNDAEREAELKKMFEEAGCAADRIAEEAVSRKDPPNIICTLPGTTSLLFIVSAHFDHVSEGFGAADDWSGASLLPSLYEALKGAPRKHTIQFIGFTGEEKGLVGSSFHVKNLTKDQLSDVKAVINLECLGLSSTKVWVHAADPRLLDYLGKVALAVHAELEAVDIQKVGNDDTQAFRNKGIRTITIHSLTQETLPILHTRKDQLDVVHLDSLFESYRLAARYLAILDQVID
jgi:hypothetical protein